MGVPGLEAGGGGWCLVKESKSYQGTIVESVAWILEKQDSDDIRADIMNLCDTTAQTPGKKVFIKNYKLILCSC